MKYMHTVKKHRFFCLNTAAYVLAGMKSYSSVSVRSMVYWVLFVESANSKKLCWMIAWLLIRVDTSQVRAMVYHRSATTCPETDLGKRGLNKQG
jgi:hypothetical protein